MKRDSADAPLPASVSVPSGVIWSPTGSGVGFSVGASANVRVSRHLRPGISLRRWGSQSSLACAVGGEFCLLGGQSFALGLYGEALWYPLGSRAAFLRAGAGASRLVEQTGFSNLLEERISWPFSILLGVGSDLQVARHVFITPFFEAQRLFVDDVRLPTTHSWILQAGLGLTIG